MIKITIIGWILLVVMTFIIKCMAANLSLEEKIMIKSKDIWPTRTIIASLIWVLIGITDVVLTIITIIKM